ncbi:type 1 glutamine amidotransferase domain-containing protein [Vibrio maritimus]|uniref:type 1 glutamine amidotransferase domain-containing protein n=1 Tax=Vibrio maritimus TaxID=990268 RepID=UPI0040698122
MTQKKILMVLTSHRRMGDTNEETGLWLEEFAAPYYVFKDAGLHITLCSPAGGHPPIDPKSQDEGYQTEATKRFENDDVAKTHLSHTLRLVEVRASDYDAIFFPGGHGPLWDLTCDPDSVTLIDDFYSDDKPIGAVCHASGVLINAANEDETPMVKGRQVTGFSNSEEAAVGLTDVVPFSLEDELVKLGASYSKAEDWAEYVVIDDKLVTGQNPASSRAAAQAILDLIADK